MEYGSYDLYKPSRYSSANHARIFASDILPESTTWSTEGPIKRAHASWSDIVMLSFSYDQDNDKVIAGTCSDASGTSPDITFAMQWNDCFYPETTYSTEGFQIGYPQGYDGNLVPSASRTGPIQGNVTCANSNNIISSIQVNTQHGLSGLAKLTNDGNGGKNYRYYLTEESPYAIVVACDGDPFFGPTSAQIFMIATTGSVQPLVNKIIAPPRRAYSTGCLSKGLPSFVWSCLLLSSVLFCTCVAL